MNIEFRDLRYFETIAELKHLGQASEALHRSQPALTKCIQRLEEELGAPLFERKGRGLALTAVGKEFYLRAKKIRETSDHHLNGMEDFIAGSAGRVRIGCGPITADYLLPTVCALALRHAPNISLEITIGTNYELKEGIRQEQLDMIVGVISTDDEFVNQGFIDDIVVVAASEGHPIFAQPSIRLEDLLEYHWILPTPPVESRKWLDRVFAANNLPKPITHIEANTLPSIHDLIASTELLCFLSKLTLDHPKTRGLLKEVRLKETTMVRKLGITYPHGTLTAATGRIIELLNQHHKKVRRPRLK